MRLKSRLRAFQWSTARRISMRSERPTISSTVRKPSSAMYSRTSWAMKRMKFTTCCGSPVNLLRSSGSCVATPTGQVLRWQARTMMQRRRNETHTRRRVADLGDPRIHLGAGKLAALAGLRSLRDLDLQLARVDQIVAGDAEAAARHLLDRGITRVPVRLALVAHRIFAALAGVRLSPDAGHSGRHRLVCLF